MRIHPRIRRLARIFGIVTGSLLGVLLILLCALLLRPMRERALDQVLQIASGSLPGTLTVREADWPALSRVELAGVEWHDDDHLLASFERLELDLDLGALTRKDLHVRTLILEDLNADIPVISANFPDEAGPEPGEGPASFPRAGSLPWSPSIALDSVRVEITHLRVDSTMSLEGDIDLGVDLLAHHAPGFSLRSLRARWPEREWQVTSDELDAVIATGEFGGSLDLDLGQDAALHLELSSADDRSFRLSLADRLSDDLPFLEVEGSFEQQPSGLVSSLVYRADLRTPDATRIEELLGRPGMLEQVAPLGRIVLHAEGDLDLSGPVQSHASVTAAASGQDIRLEARIEQTGGAVEINASKIDAEGLTLTARGRYDDGRYDAILQGDLAGVAFLQDFVDVSDLPADLRGRIELQLEGEGSRAEPDLRILGAAPSAGLDSLDVLARGRVDGRDSDLRIAIRSLLREQVAVGVDARLLDLEAPRVHLAPVQVDRSLDRLVPGAIPDSPTLQIDLDQEEIRIAGLRVTGTAGELSLDAQAATAAGGSGKLHLDWPVLPAALELAGLDVAGLDSLLGPHWTDDGTPGLEVSFTLDPGARSGEVEASLMLPAPWKLVEGLAPESYEAEPLVGALHGRWNDQGSWNADLDLAATTWLDSAFAHLRAVDGSVHLDSLLVRGGPARVTAAGSLDSTNIDGKAQLDLVPHPALASLAPDLPDDLQFLLNLRAGITGRVDAPDARAKLLASARSSAFTLPLLSVETEVVEGIPQRGVVDILEPASIGNFSIDAAHIELAPEDPAESLFPLWASIGVTGDVEWAQLARVDSLAGAWHVRTDSLRVGASGQSMRSLNPFELVIAPGDSVIQFDGLDLAGDAGSITGSLDLAPGRARADLEVHLDASIPSALVQAPPQMLPSGYHLIMRGSEEDLTSSLWIEGINLGGRRDILARLDAERAGNQMAIDIQAKDELGVVASGDLTLPLSIDLLTREFQWHDGDLSGKVEVDSLPLPWSIGGGEGMSQFLLGTRDESAPLLDARLLFGGTGQYPAVGARLGVGFPEIEELRDDRFELDAIWVGPGTETNSLGLFDDPTIIQQLEETLPHGGAAALGSLMRAGRPVATARAGFPLAENSTSPIPGFGKEDRIAFDVSAEPLVLDEFSQVLPRGSEVGGKLWISARGDGPIGDLPLEASIRMEEVSFRQSFGSNGVVSGQIDVTGRSSAPTIRGALKVSSALVRLPESGRDLHPVQGESQLWTLGLKPVDRFAALDTLEVDWGWSFSPVDSTTTAEPALTLAESTDLDVKIEIPNSFWIRGQGLEVQLAGDLQAELQNGVPRVVGELQAISGQLEVVGARLRLDRGLVHFYGGDTSNPGLDLELSRDQGDVRVMVRVTGTAQEPRLAFDSDPPMSQSDIMSYLLFGSAASDLDGAQTQLLQDQAAAALSQFAAPMLENELTQSLGITMMQLQAGENPDDGLSLVVGKYVTPQILVKYEQSLKDRQKYTVNAEYWLNRNFRIETRLSDSRSTGIQLNWSRDY